MATLAAATARPEEGAPRPAEPLLEPGDRLSRAEFERRYDRMPHLKKAELIEGTVYMPSPVRLKTHAEPHNQLGTWLGTYVSETPGVEAGDNSTVRLDLDNEPQPDLVLIKLPVKGGQARISADDYIEGRPSWSFKLLPARRLTICTKKRALIGATGSSSTWPGLPASSESFGGNCAKENITKSLQPRTACSRAAFFPAFGSTATRC